MGRPFRMPLPEGREDQAEVAFFTQPLVKSG